MKSKNKKGNAFLNIFLGLFIYISGIFIWQFLLDDITTARANLGCEALTTLTLGTQLTCIAISGLSPYIIWFLISITFGFIIGGLNE